MVKGLQGKDLTHDGTIIAQPKHFAVHGIPESGSNTAPVGGGAVLTVGGLARVTRKRGDQVTWSVTGAGSRIVLPDVTVLEGVRDGAARVR